MLQITSHKFKKAELSFLHISLALPFSFENNRVPFFFDENKQSLNVSIHPQVTYHLFIAFNII